MRRSPIHAACSGMLKWGARKTILSFRSVGNMRDELDLRLHGNGENMKRVNRSLSRFFCRTLGLGLLLALLGAQSGGSLVVSARASAFVKCDVTLRPRQLSDGFRSLSIGYHSLLVKNDGSLWAWGSNRYGELGDGAQSDRDQTVHKQIGTGFRSAVAGSLYSLAVKEDGTLWSWGLNDSGQLGDGTKINRSSPQQIGSGFRSVAAGWSHSLGLKEDGSLWVWGNNFYGQLGVGTQDEKLIPTQVAGDYVAVFAGQFNSVALRRDGSLWAWGKEPYVEYTKDGAVTKDKSVLFPIKIGSDFKMVAVGENQGLGVKNDGSLWTWKNFGNGLDGRMGKHAYTLVKISDGMVINEDAREYEVPHFGKVIGRLMPAKINGGFVAIASGGHHSLLLRSDGRVWIWGKDPCGEFGWDEDDPFRVPRVVDVAAIYAAGSLSLATKKDGTVWAWGRIETIKQLEAALADGAKSDDQQIPSTGR